MAGKHKKAEPVNPDLPITPMLDMTFQLLSFFIMTFNPQAKEAMIFITLPEEKGSGASIPDPTSTELKPVILVFEVQVAANRDLGPITLRIEDKDAPVGGKSAQIQIADLNGYRSTLASKMAEYKAANRQVKVQLEIAPTLPWKNTVLLIDIAKQSGYTDVAPTILGK